MNALDQIHALERVLKLINIHKMDYEGRSKEELANGNPRKYTRFHFIVAGMDAAMSEIKSEIFLLKNHEQRHKK